MTDLDPIPLAPRIEAIASDLVDDYVGKNLSKKAGATLAQRVAELARIHASQMLTYGPEEIGRIARFEGADESLVRRILAAGGANVVDAEGVRASWARLPSGTVAKPKPSTMSSQGLDLGTVRARLKQLLHAARDTMRNRGVVTTSQQFSIDVPEYAEAWGYLRLLADLGVGVIAGRLNGEEMILPDWLREIENEVLAEEHFGTTGRCAYCHDRYGKDDAIYIERFGWSYGS